MTFSRMTATRVAALLTIAILTTCSGAAIASARLTRHALGTAAKGSGEPTSKVTASTNPCTFVPARNATAIFHAKVKETEAPLGPTCIFTVKGKKASDTLAVEVVNITQTVRKMKHVSKFKLTGHQGYCGDLGTAQLFVKLRDHEVLAVHAPCKTGKALAGVAIRHIKT
jgi:hypothetical protein